MKEKSWRCRTGLHRWFIDSAMFTSGKRCDDCFVWQDPLVGAEVERERRLWVKHSQQQGLDDDWDKVKARVAYGLAIKEDE